MKQQAQNTFTDGLNTDFHPLNCKNTILQYGMENPNGAVSSKKNSILNKIIKVVLPLVLGIYIVYYLIIF